MDPPASSLPQKILAGLLIWKAPELTNEALTLSRGILDLLFLLGLMARIQIYQNADRGGYPQEQIDQYGVIIIRSMDQKSKGDYHPHFRASLSSDFFEVSINSQKLSEMFVRLNTIITQQDIKLLQFSTELKENFRALEEKIEREAHRSGMLHNKLENKINDSFQSLNLIITHVKETNDASGRGFTNDIEVLKSKIGRVEDYSKDDLEKGLANLKKSIIGSLSSTFHDHQDPIDFAFLLQKAREEAEKAKQEMKTMWEQFYDKKEEERKVHEREQMVRRALMRKEVDESVQVYINQKDLPMNQVRYPTMAKTGGPRLESEEGKQNGKAFRVQRHVSCFQNSGSMDEEIVQGYKAMRDKMSLLEKAIGEKDKEMKEVKNKQIVSDERAAILQRKNDKISQEMYDLRSLMRRVEERKMDDKALEELRNYVKWSVRDLEEKIEKKCTEEALNKERLKLNEKISILHENLIEKADKGQITKAIFFLEEKMKEIIFLIASEQQDERDGAVIKTNIKCLSCDKHMEKSKKMMQGKCIQEGPLSKPMTHRVRKRYREQLKQNYTVGNDTLDDFPR